jgi:hypothetical protein
VPEHGIDGCFSIHRRRVQGPCVIRNTKRRDHAIFVTPVTLQHGIQNLFVYSALPLAPQLVEAPTRSRRRGGGDEQLDVRVGANDRPHIPTGQYGTPPAPAEGTLERQQRRAHAWEGCHLGGCLAHRFAAQQRLFDVGGAEFSGGAQGRGLVVSRQAFPQQLAADRAIEQAGIEKS